MPSSRSIRIEIFWYDFDLFVYYLSCVVLVFLQYTRIFYSWFVLIDLGLLFVVRLGVFGFGEEWFLVPH